MTKHGKTILLCEGVAGSGKSTLTHFLEDIDGIGVVRASLEKREFDNYEAAMKSQFNDYAKLVAALHDPNPVVLIERFALSQCVYGSIRQNFTDRLAHSGIGFSIQQLLACATNEYSWRHSVFPTTKYSFGWIVIAPKPSVTKRLRKKGGKGYPHNPNHEAVLYRLAAKELRDVGEIVFIPPIDAPLNISRYREVTENWMAEGQFHNIIGLFNEFILSKWKD